MAFIDRGKNQKKFLKLDSIPFNDSTSATSYFLKEVKKTEKTNRSKNINGAREHINNKEKLKIAFETITSILNDFDEDNRKKMLSLALADLCSAKKPDSPSV